MTFDVMAIGAHPDDVEIGMGGTVLALANEGYKVGILDLTNGEPTPRGSVAVRHEESQAAAKILKASGRITLDLKNRYLQDTLEARIQIAEVFREHRPKVLFLPYWLDAHPDHVAACAVTEAARFYAKLTNTTMKHEPHYPDTIFYYFSCHINLNIKPSFIIDVSATYDEKKKSIAAYVSQNASSDKIMRMIDSINVYQGSLIHAAAGEAFICKEEIGLSSISALLR